LNVDGRQISHAQSIDELIIDPKAEGVSPLQPGSGNEEVRFFTEAGEQYKLLHNQQSLGLLGKLWGSNCSAPTNIAGLLLLICFVMGALSFAIDQNAEIVSARSWLFGVTTTILGFLFGARTTSKSE
jgi:hypothetical protein